MQKKLGIVVVAAIQTPPSVAQGKRPGVSQKTIRGARRAETPVRVAA